MRLKTLDELEITDWNLVQVVITRIIYQTEKFTYDEIDNKIREFLEKKEVPEYWLGTFKLINMIRNTLDLLVQNGTLNLYNYTYTNNSKGYINEKEQIKILKLK